jgi:hypothetical protein
LGEVAEGALSVKGKEIGIAFAYSTPYKKKSQDK